MRQGKTGKEVSVPLNEAVLTLLGEAKGNNFQSPYSQWSQ